MKHTEVNERIPRSGFALIELLVAIGIIVILSVSLLFQQNKFDSSIQLTNVAYEIAGIIQQAQRYGASSVIGSSSDVDVGYGVYFNLGYNKRVIFFQDRNSNNRYDDGEEIETYTMSGATSINDICIVTPPLGTLSCLMLDVSIVFNRPDPEPSRPAQIIIENGGETRTIEVSQTGQVQVTR